MQILMCTDGLTNMVDDKTIESVLSSENSTEEKVKKLITEANE